MKNYFKILELTPEAGEEEIKKAYFKLIRQYPPDKNPDKFKEIREAYEMLKQEKFREEFKMIQKIPSPFREVYQSAREYEDKQDYTSAIKVCLEGLRIEPDQPDLNYYLIQLYLSNEQTGKAVKRLENLTGRYRDNVKLEGLLAVAYDRRGWNKKAGSQFEKAYRLGERSSEFLVFYINNLIGQKQYGYAKDLAFGILDGDSFEVLCQKGIISDIFSALFQIYLNQVSLDRNELFRRFNIFLKENKNNAARIKSVTMDVLEDVVTEIDYKNHDTAILVYLSEIFHNFEDLSDYESITLFNTDLMVEKVKLIQDNRLGNSIQDAAVIYYSKAMLPAEEYGLFAEEIEIAELDVKLVILDEYSEIKNELEIIKAEYPLLKKEMEVFLEELDKNENKVYLWNKYEKIYCKKAGYPSGSHLTRSDACEKEEIEEELSFYQESYKREQLKIGRNDPCPCGSGKKYKKCCGR